MLRYFLSKLHLMRKSISFIWAVFAIWGTIIGCSEKFDDTQIWEKMNSLEERVIALEQLGRQRKPTSHLYKLFSMLYRIKII